MNGKMDWPNACKSFSAVHRANVLDISRLFLDEREEL